MCRVLRVSRSGYYAWRKRPPSKRARKDAMLTEKIRQIHEKSRGTYGSPRIHAALQGEGIRVGEKRVARLMKAAGLRRASHRKRPSTTIRDDSRRPAPYLVDRDFTASEPDELWVADITYVPTDRDYLYLSVVLDAFSRRIVGWAMADHLRTEIVLEALDMAAQQRSPEDTVPHSDQGSQYTAIAFGQRCKNEGVRPSMGSVGDCYDTCEKTLYPHTSPCWTHSRIQRGRPVGISVRERPRRGPVSYRSGQGVDIGDKEGQLPDTCGRLAP
jgi:putative transposase